MQLDKEKPVNTPKSEVERAIEKAAKILGDGAKVVDPDTIKERKESDDISPFKKVPEADKQAFIRALLSGESFAKTYNLFKNNVSVTFRVLDELTLGVLRESAAQYGPIGSAPYNRQYHLSRFLYAVTNLRVGSKQLADAELAVDEFTLTSMNSITYRALLQSYNTFEELCDTLYEIAADPNF